MGRKRNAIMGRKLVQRWRNYAFNAARDLHEIRVKGGAEYIARLKRERGFVPVLQDYERHYSRSLKVVKGLYSTRVFGIYFGTSPQYEKFVRLILSKYPRAAMGDEL